MGVDAQHARFLFWARQKGVRFDRTAMIGRQQCDIRPDIFKRILQEFAPDQTMGSEFTGTEWAEPLLRFLGARVTDSIDVSPGESPTYLHDMNLPISATFKERYSVVLDGGTLEHVFNYPTAMRNCMEMVEQNGHLLVVTVANNCPNHGFYQFSPGLLASALSDQNGFHLETLIVCGTRPDSPWYPLSDPWHTDVFRTLGRSRVYLLAIARRVRITSIFAAFPQQSERDMHWSDEDYM